MKVGVPKEIKVLEYRVGMIPSGVKELVNEGHEVFVETDAGMGIGMTDQDYIDAGASILSTPEEVFDISELIIKVKEPQLNECRMLKSGQVLFTYLHLAADPEQAAALVKSGVTAIAYETVTADNGSLPLLTPMSAVAGRLSIQAGAYALQKANGGRGVLLGGVPGVKAGQVLIIGGGVSGAHAAEMAVGLGAQVTILDLSSDRLNELSNKFGDKVSTRVSSKELIKELVIESDLVIGAVLVAGAAAPKLLSHDLIKRMKKGAVVVDVAIDQGGCFETSKPTTHQEPTYIVNDVVHYCVANMPGGVARTATMALNNATLPYAIALANDPVKALLTDQHLQNGLNVHKGSVTYKAVADALGYDYLTAAEALKA